MDMKISEAIKARCPYMSSAVMVPGLDEGTYAIREAVILCQAEACPKWERWSKDQGRCSSGDQG